MVRKLMKYDFMSYLKLLLPFQLIMLGVSALMRLLYVLKGHTNYALNLLASFTAFVWTLGIIGCCFITIILIVIRFYQSMYKNEGYLSHTLPVSPVQHIISKLSISLLFMLGSVLTVFLSFIIGAPFDIDLPSFFNTIGKLNRSLEIGGINTAVFWIELILLCVFGILAFILRCYFCVSVGQTAQKRKVLLSFGVYFGLYFARQIVSSTVLAIFSPINDLYLESDTIQNYTEIIYQVFGFGIVVSVIGCILYFVLTQYFMKNKLNL